MNVTQLNIDGSWIIELKKFEDSRGFFYESFRNEIAKKYFGREFNVKQSNTSVNKKGSVRGIHYALVPPISASHLPTPGVNSDGLKTTEFPAAKA